MASDPADKSQRRAIREQALKTFNGLAEALELQSLAYRPSNSAVQSLFKGLAAKVDADQLSTLKDARNEWLQNGGCDLPESFLSGAEKRAAAASGSWEHEQEAGRVPGHCVLTQTF